VTLVPALAETAAQVTMLQRSPTYVVARPEQDALANFLRRHLPSMLAYNLVRWRNILFGIYFFSLCKRSPERVKKWILGRVKSALGADYDVGTHFSPGYNPWDQRMCLVPDGDLFEAIKQGKAAEKRPIMALVERGGKVRSFHVPNVTAKLLRPIIGRHAHPDSRFMSDESVIYTGIGWNFGPSCRLEPAYI